MRTLKKLFLILMIAGFSLPALAATETGMASWYGPGFHGQRSASGEIFSQQELTAAHRTLPFGTTIRVTNLENGKSVVVRINDRGPYAKGRILDLSRAAAKQLKMTKQGKVRVLLSVLSLGCE